MIRAELLSAPGGPKCRTAKAVVDKLIEQAREIIGELGVDQDDVRGRGSAMEKLQLKIGGW